MSGNASGLDWRTAAHWAGGRTQPCRFCRRPAFLLDDNGNPAHKTCAEDAVFRADTADPRPTQGGTDMPAAVHAEPPDPDQGPGQGTGHVANDKASSLRAAALTAAGRGWHVFPVVPNGKRPAIKDWLTRATTDPSRIERCWTPGPRGEEGRWNHARWNVGIACGPSGLIVLDLDRAAPGEDVPLEYEQSPTIRSGVGVLADLEGAYGELPDTYTVATPNGGEHRYFTATEGIEQQIGNAKLAWKIDVRGCGGLVVAAGSTINGRPYAELNPATGQLTEPTDGGASCNVVGVAALPGWIRDQLVAKLDDQQPFDGPGGQGRSRDRPLPVDPEERRRYVAAAVRGELIRVLSAKNLNARNLGPNQNGPGRNTDLYQAACQLGQLVATGDLDKAVVFAALTAAAQAVGLTRDEAERTTASGLRKGATQPRPDHQNGRGTERRRAA